MERKLKISVLMMLILCAFCACNEPEESWFVGIKGKVYDSVTMEVLSGAAVSLSPSGKSQVTDAEGSFFFEELDPQQYTITVQKSGYKSDTKTVNAVYSEDVELIFTLEKKD